MGIPFIKKILICFVFLSAPILQAAEFEVMDILTVNGVTHLKSSATIIVDTTIPSSIWVSTSATTPHLYISTAGKVGIGTKEPEARLEVGGDAKITDGLKANYDSGWFALSAPGAHTTYTLDHNLGVLPTRYQIWFSVDNPPTWIYPRSHGNSVDYNTTAGMMWPAPHGIRFNSTSVQYTVLSGQAIFRYYTAASGWTGYTSGYMRFLIWK